MITFISLFQYLLKKVCEHFERHVPYLFNALVTEPILATLFTTIIAAYYFDLLEFFFTSICAAFGNVFGRDNEIQSQMSAFLRLL